VFGHFGGQRVELRQGRLQVQRETAVEPKAESGFQQRKRMRSLDQQARAQRESLIEHVVADREMIAVGRQAQRVILTRLRPLDNKRFQDNE
jgi:hypothetical protein